MWCWHCQSALLQCDEQPAPQPTLLYDADSVNLHCHSVTNSQHHNQPYYMTLTVSICIVTVWWTASAPINVPSIKVGPNRSHFIHTIGTPYIRQRGHVEENIVPCRLKIKVVIFWGFKHSLWRSPWKKRSKLLWMLLQLITKSSKVAQSTVVCEIWSDFFFFFELNPCCDHDHNSNNQIPRDWHMQMHCTKPGWLQVVKKLAPDNTLHQARLVASG